MEIESKSSAFGIRITLGEERKSFCLSPIVGWLSLDQDLIAFMVEIKHDKENKLSFSTHQFDW